MYDDFQPTEWPRILQLPGFTRYWDKLGLDNTALVDLEIEILEDVLGHPVMKGTGGLHKVRFVPPGESRGRSGAYRVGYFAFPSHGLVILAILWSKNEKANLTSSERNAIAKVASEIEELLKKGMI
ncbi:hypothetical protein SAMN05444166_4529 [Singulisphaera sp. GP187]|uniref:hypothetical protein n=1 Tax=Singulisphaera sp. GP187 TaxID=1882752 RepID=UPI00092CBBC5|nr:hypothetical protein [Singulisphaera sp. GP187]SIO41687.1 hypothetical protein SAMN05444166_4529 [Singulisphaera sp. GP187]